MGRRRKAPQKSHVVVVLDRSGSMASIADDTVGGFNSFIKQLREDAAENTFVTLVQFDTVHDTVYEQKPLADVPDLDFLPRGGTALLDGVGIAIQRVEKFARPGDNVAVTIMTDGGENSSREYTKEAVTALMDEKRKDDWEFNFLGAGPQSWQGATMLGIQHSHTINYAGTGADQGVAFAAAAASNTAKTRGLSSSYLETAAESKMALEAEAGTPDILNVPRALGRRSPRRRDS
jgi:hypothetical protein